MNRDIDNEAQGLAAEAVARQNAGRGGGGAGPQPPPDVRIEWNGIARRARRLSVPGTAIGGLTPSPEGHSVALTVSSAAGGGRGGAAAAADPTAGMYVINVESGQLTRVPPAPVAAGAGGAGGRGRGRAGGGFGGGSKLGFGRHGR